MEERIIDQIITGTKFPELQKQLLNKNKAMSMSEVLNMCRSYEVSVNYMRQMDKLQGKSDNQISAIKHRLEDTDNCGKCGLNHKNGNCPARSSTCSACGRKNHWARMCHNKKTKKKKRTGNHRWTGVPNPKNSHQCSMHIKISRTILTFRTRQRTSLRKCLFIQCKTTEKSALGQRHLPHWTLYYQTGKVSMN